MSNEPVLIQGEWKQSSGTEIFQADNPSTGKSLDQKYPVSAWDEIDQAIEAAKNVFNEIRKFPGERFADFLEAYANLIESNAEELANIAHEETALPVSPRLKDVEIPRTVNQLKLGAKAARSGEWSLPVIDNKNSIRSVYGAIGPVVVFGPNNFPFAFNGISGGDFASAIAAGNPVIAKGHPCHPRTSQRLAELALDALKQTKMPLSLVQMIYRTNHEDGAKIVSDSRIGAIGYTGSQSAGLALKEKADKVGKPIYLELSSTNPVLYLPGAIKERGDSLAEEFTGSCLMGTGQFCTNPGLILLLESEESENWISDVKSKFESAPAGTLLAKAVQNSFLSGAKTLLDSGAELLTGGEAADVEGFGCQNTLFKISGDQFLKSPEKMQTEVFGNSSLIVVAKNSDQLAGILENLEGNLTGSIYSESNGADEALYDEVAPILRQKVGRLLNDKMPTGVAVSPAMNHGGPFPATGHPGFTSVGIPASLRRFSMLHCYDNVRPHRLPVILQDENPDGSTWRMIDDCWTLSDV
jgi:2,5-dioxopentanoate dehydrogenase